MFRSRSACSGVAFLTSAVMFLMPSWFAYRAWHPEEWVPFTGSSKIWWIIAITAALTPLLVAIVYKPQVRALAFDMLAIFLLQCVVTGLALNALYQGRPAWIAFVKDDWRMLSPLEMSVVSGSFTLGLEGPQWVASRYSEDSSIRNVQISLELFEGIPIESDARTFVPLEDALQDLLGAARGLSELSVHNSKDAVEEALRDFPQAQLWLPLKGFKRDGVVLLDSGGIPLAPVLLAPWD